MRPRLADIARTTAAEHSMFPEGAVVLAMVSGGADSTALLRLFASRELAEGARVAVLHVNHLLRGADSEEDEAFVRGLAADLGAPFRAVRYDVGAYAAEAGLNLEDAGRRVRYRFAEEELDSVCERLGAPAVLGRIATAHTLDDQVETFLMRLLGGAGPAGLSAIPPVRGRIVRPLIDARRHDITAHLEALGQDWREDVTNADTSRTRARVRHEVLPALEAAEPAVVETVARTVRIIAEEDRLLDDMAGAFARDFCVAEGGRLAFDRALMQTLSRPMLRRVVRKALSSAFPESSRIEFEHIEAIVVGLAEEDFARDLPGGLRAHAEYERLVVERADGAPISLVPSLLELPGECDLGPGGQIVAEMLAADSGQAAGLSEDDRSTIVIDAGTISGPLIVDGPRAGDRMRPLGMTGTKKLSDLLVDAKIPRRERPLTPVVRDGDSIVWLAGVRMSEDYRVTESTTERVRLTWSRE